MNTQHITLDQISKGRAVEELNSAIAKACEDAICRSRINKPRKVVLEVIVTPEIDVNTDENFPVVDYKVKQPQLPPIDGIGTRCKVVDGKVVNSNQPVAGKQQTMLGGEE